LGERLTRKLPQRLVFSALLAGTLTASPCGAQSGSPAVDRHEAAVRRLIDVMGAGGFPTAVWDEMRRQLAPEDFARLQIAIYKKHFSLEEIEGLKAFFESPLGRRFLKEQPGLTIDAVAMAKGLDRRPTESLTSQPAWTAPVSPDPQQILREAVDDAAARRYDVALEKQLWFHKNALRYNGGLAGVRLSFALGYWRQLADVYPPGLDALKRTRDEAWSAIVSGADTTVALPSFRDFAALNRTLGEESRTAVTFAQLDREKPEVALRVAAAARPALIRAKEFELCAKYVDPDLWENQLAAYRSARRSAETSGLGSEAGSFLDRKFTNDAATLVALLVVSGRRAEAERVAAEAKHEKDDAEFVAVIDKALLGNVPAPWP